MTTTARPRTPQRSAGRRGRPREWTDQRIAEVLLALVGEGGRMPTALELDIAGWSGLRYAIAATGGTRYWARELGLSLSDRQAHVATADAVLHEQARQLAAALGHLPGATKLRQLGYGALAQLVARSGGSRGLCQQLGITYVDGRTSAVRRRE